MSGIEPISVGRRLLVGRHVVALTLLIGAACDNRNSDSSSRDAVADSTLSAVSGQAEDPAAVIREYYAAIAAHDYRRAYLLWGDSGRASNQTFEQFRSGFASTASVNVRIGEPGRVEGAAGSRYVDIPVEIEATATSGGIQRFAGTYVLRRTIVDGATESQMRWHIYSADIDPCAGDRCVAPGAGATEAMEVVRRFGEHLRMVSSLGPPDTVVRAIREQYAPLITQDLLDRWVDEPASAPGREVSNPWPQGIAITDIQPEGDEGWSVAANIVYVTSADTTLAVDLEPVTLQVIHREGAGWRIADVDY